MKDKLNVSFQNCKKDFPIFSNNKNLIYVDNAATTQKPQIVLNAMNDFYTKYNSNVHRGIHFLSEKATDEYEITRDKVANYLNCKREEIIFTYGTTHGINVLAFGFKHLIKKGDEIVISAMEHHANIVPWQEVCIDTGAILRVIPLTNEGELDYDTAKKIISKKTKVLSIAHSSNVLGTINDVSDLAKYTKEQNKDAFVFIDGAQQVSQGKVDVSILNCDSYVISAHKIFGPTGVGAMYVKEGLIESVKPLIYGGSMIEDVSFEKTTYAKGFHKLEAGTPTIASVIGFGAAIDYMNFFNQDELKEYKQDLTNYFLEKSKELGDDFRLFGPKTSNNRNPVFSFTYTNIHPHDLTKFLDKYYIAVRSGHHCAIPLHRELGVDGTTRVSLSMYNTKEDIDKIITALKDIKKIF